MQVLERFVTVFDNAVQVVAELGAEPVAGFDPPQAVQVAFCRHVAEELPRDRIACDPRKQRDAIAAQATDASRVARLIGAFRRQPTPRR
jgi:hypothetical protein